MRAQIQLLAVRFLAVIFHPGTGKTGTDIAFNTVLFTLSRSKPQAKSLYPRRYRKNQLVDYN